nr:hypothetical protein CFP56_57786 [Quercus suber]
MSGDGEARSSELKTGLASFEDRRAFKVTSLSTLYKAWDVLCVLKGKDEGPSNKVRKDIETIRKRMTTRFSKSHKRTIVTSFEDSFNNRLELADTEGERTIERRCDT